MNVNRSKPSNAFLFFSLSLLFASRSHNRSQRAATSIIHFTPIHHNTAQYILKDIYHHLSPTITVYLRASQGRLTVTHNKRQKTVCFCFRLFTVLNLLLSSSRYRFTDRHTPTHTRTRSNQILFLFNINASFQHALIGTNQH